MFGPKARIRITVKLYGGLDLQAGMENYDPENGIGLDLPRGARLKKALKRLGLNHAGAMAFFINGKKAGPREKLNDGDTVFCMRPVSGG